MDMTLPRGRIALAVILILLGLLVLLNNLGLFSLGTVWSRLWPSLLVLLGLWWLVSGGGLLALLLTTGAGVLLAERTGLLPEGGLSRYWPVLLIAAGAWSLARRRRGSGIVIVRRDLRMRD